MAFKTFTGTLSQYNALHYWVKKHLGKPMECENCGTTEIRKYAWANISGEYHQKLDDWVRLCYRCHSLIDGMPYRVGEPRERPILLYCRHGHELSVVGVYIDRNGSRLCQECRRISKRKFNRKISV